MSETVFQRTSRVLSAKIEDAVDRMERAGSDGVMREAIREVDRAIDCVRSEHVMATTRRLRSVRQQIALKERAVDLTDKARFAINEGRDDLAEAALSRQVHLERQVGELEAIKAESELDEARLGASLAALGARKREMENAMATFLAARRPQPNDTVVYPGAGVERRVHQAEQAFQRAMGGACGVSFARADADTIAQVAEIEVMQKRSIVAMKIRTLKEGSANASSR